MASEMKLTYFFVLILVSYFTHCLTANPSQEVQGRINLCKRVKISSLPDFNYCHRYYSCENPWIGRECRYPDVYSILTRSCQHYSKVRCGSRIEPKSQCDYRVYRCQSSHCIPCSVRHPSCKGLHNGINPHKIKTNSPYYMECRNGRLVKEGRCSMERHKLNFPMYGVQRYCLDPYGDRCKMGGKQLTGLYPSTGCSIFIRCYRGRKFYLRCPKGTAFDRNSNRCLHEHSVCEPCGSKKCKESLGFLG